MNIPLLLERLKLNQTQKHVAESIGITTQMLSSYEQNKVHPTYKTMRKISNFYAVPIETLFSDEPTNE